MAGPLLREFPMSENEPKVIIITGASRGIGRAAALELKKHRLVLGARDLSALEEIASEVQRSGSEALVCPLDVTNEESVQSMINSALEAYGKIDVLINNAGIGSFRRVDEFSLEEFDYIYRVNMLGTFLCSKYVAPHMIAQKSGQIINVASVAGLNGFQTGTAYASSKFAMVGFTESLREDLKEFGIAVTALCPGAVLTEFGSRSIEEKSRAEYLLMPEDVARTIGYLVEESETANAKLIELKPRRKREAR